MAHSAAVEGDPPPVSALTIFVDQAAPLYGPALLIETAQGIGATLLPLCTTQSHLSRVFLGVVLACISLSRSVLNIPCGALCDRLGIRVVMYGGCLMLVPVGAAATLTRWWPPGLVLATLAWGACISAFYVGRHSYASYVFPQRRATVMALIGGSFRGGMVVGPLVAGVATELLGDAYVPMALFMPLAASAASLIMGSPHVAHVDAIVHSKRHGGHDEGGGSMAELFKAHGPMILRVAPFAFGFVLVRAARRTLLPLAALELRLPPSVVGAVLSVSFTVDTVLFFLAAILTEMVGPRVAASVSLCVMGVAFVLLPLATTPTVLYAVAALLGLGDALSSGMLLTLLADSSSGSPRLLGVLRTAQDSGAIVGPFVASALTHVASLGASSFVVAVVSFIVALWASLLPDGRAVQEQKVPRV